MAKFAKWIGGGLGWAFLGPIGGLIGFAIGYYLDEQPGLILSRPVTKTTTGDFVASMLVLVAAMMKADGVVRRSELDYVKTNLVASFGEETALEASLMLRELLKQEIPTHEVCHQIAQHLDYPSRLQLLHFLFGIAMADGELHPSEVLLIEEIAQKLGISQSDFTSLQSFTHKTTNTDYEALGITPGATETEIKKAYRAMANMYHPDKVSYLGEDFRLTAEEKFTKLNQAYERIKRERGFS
ncbi:MAG: hypothetical protein RIS47_2111 [Bacteroidota bacterium]|jgi:DnaJ like chaperone protein